MTESITTEKGLYRLNDFQKAAVAVYGNGDFSYLADRVFKNFADFRDHLREEISDMHLEFILVELGAPDCDNAEEAQNRMSRAADEINDVYGALCRLAEAPSVSR